MQQEVPATDSSVKPENVAHDDAGFDVFLDEEVTVNPPEASNLIREVVEVDAPHPVHDHAEVAPPQNENSLSDSVNADNDTIEIENAPGHAAPVAPLVEEQNTQSPVERVQDDVQQDEVVPQQNEAAVPPPTEQSNVAVNDEVVYAEQETITVSPVPSFSQDDPVHESVATNAPVNDEIFNDDDTTERLFRTDIFREHIEVPRDNVYITTSAPEVQENHEHHEEAVANDEVPSVTNADEPVTSPEPEVQPYRNKVQKVTEALAAQNDVVPESGESSGNKFRLELDVFRGSQESWESEKLVEVDVTTRGPVYDDTVHSTEFSARPDEDAPVFDDVAAPTQPPSQFHDEVSTERVIHDFISENEVAEDSHSNDQPIVTTQSSSAVVQHDSISDATEGSGSDDLSGHDDPESAGEESIATTLPPVLVQDEADHVNEIVSNDEPVTNSYSFRMGSLNSLEDTENLVQHDVIAPTQPPSPAELHDDVVAVTEVETFVNDEPTSGPVSFNNDEATATDVPPQFRLDLEVATEADMESRNEAVDQATEVITNNLGQNDYVEVSTGAPSGFAAEYRDDTITIVAENDAPAVTVPSNDPSEPDVQDETQTNAPLQDSQSKDHIEPLIEDFAGRREDISVEQRDEAVTVVHDEQVVTQRSDISEQQNEVVTSSRVVFLDEVSTVQPGERLRGEPVLIEQQTEAQIVQDSPVENNEVEGDLTTTESIIVDIPRNKSEPVEVKQRREEIVLPERGLPKIQPISPDLSRTPPHQLRFDFPIPSEKENTWLSRAVNQFRRLTGFGNSAPKPSKGTVSSARVPNHRFLLF